MDKSMPECMAVMKEKNEGPNPRERMITYLERRNIVHEIVPLHSWAKDSMPRVFDDSIVWSLTIPTHLI